MKELKVLEDIIGLKFQYYNTIKNIEENSTIQIAAPKVGTTEDTKDTKDTKGSSSTVTEDIGTVGPDTVMGVIILNKYNIIIIYNKNEIKFYNINNIINTLQFNNLLFKLYFNNIINIITPVTVLAHTATEVLPGTNTLITGAVVPSTVTEGKGANSTATECTSEKNPNEIAAVTRSGESSTFSVDTNSKANTGTSVKGVTEGTDAVGPSTVTDNILIELEEELILYNIKNLKIILKYKKIKKKLYKYKLINNLLIIIYENKLKIYKINQLIFFHQFNFNITFLSNFFQNYFILIDQYNHLYYLEISSVAVLGQTASNEPDINSNKDITVVPGSNSTNSTNSTKDTSTVGPSTVTTGKGANFTATECTPGKGANSTAMECTTTNTTITGEKNLNEIAVVTKTGESNTFSELAPTGADDDRVVYIEEDEVVVAASTVMKKLMEIELKNYENYKIISLYIYNNNIIISLYNNIDFLLLITKLSNNQLIILYYSFNELFIEYNNMEGNLGENNGNLGNLEGNLGNLGNSENLVNSDVDNLEINYFLFEKWNILLIYSNKSISTLLITNNINLINFNTSVTGSGTPDSNRPDSSSTDTEVTSTNTGTIGTVGPSTVTEENSNTRFATPGKGANFTATECTMGKGANFTATECTMGKGANFTATECTTNTSGINTDEDPFGVNGIVGRVPDTVMEKTNEIITYKLENGKLQTIKTEINEFKPIENNFINKIIFTNKFTGIDFTIWESNIWYTSAKQITLISLKTFNHVTVLGPTGTGPTGTGPTATDTTTGYGPSTSTNVNNTIGDITTGYGGYSTGIEGTPLGSGTGSTGGVGASTVMDTVMEEIKLDKLLIILQVDNNYRIFRWDNILNLWIDLSLLSPKLTEMKFYPNDINTNNLFKNYSVYLKGLNYCVEFHYSIDFLRLFTPKLIHTFEYNFINNTVNINNKIFNSIIKINGISRYGACTHRLRYFPTRGS